MDESPLKLEPFLRTILEYKGSDVYIVPGAKVMAKVNDQLEPISADKLRLSDCEDLIRQIYARAEGRKMERLETEGDDDFSFGLANMGRFRCSAFKQRGTLAAVLRVVPFQLPDPKALHIPEAVLNIAVVINTIPNRRSTSRTGSSICTGTGFGTTLISRGVTGQQRCQVHRITLLSPAEVEALRPRDRP